MSFSKIAIFTLLCIFMLSGCNKQKDINNSIAESEQSIEYDVWQKNVLEVYALKENVTVQKAIQKFQAKNPNKKIVFLNERDVDSLEVPKDMENGTGPDILILDGLFEKDFVEKNLLMDLRETLGFGKSQMLRPLENNKEYYSVPTRVIVPMLLLQRGVPFPSLGKINNNADNF